MDVVVVVVVGIAAVLVLLGSVWLVRVAVGRWQSAPQGEVPARPPLVAGCAEIVLDVSAAADAGGAADRLVDQASEQVFAVQPGARCVEVLSRDGSLLGRRDRERSDVRPSGFPELRRPRPHHAHPDLTGHMDEDEPYSLPPRARPIEIVPKGEPGRERLLADRFELPPAVLAGLRDRDDAIELVLAILAAGRVEMQVHGDLTVAGDTAIVVLPPPPSGPWVSRDALNHAYLRIDRSGAEHGLVIAFGLLDPEDLRHREFAAPHVRHVGPQAVQRMADAAALGGDPVRFALGPPIHAAPPSWVVRSVEARAGTTG